MAELFTGFAACSLSGFGGVLPFARRMIVDQRRWMTQDEFNETFALSQFLPGPNIVNFSVVFGSRFGGATGAAVALAGLLGPPVAIVTVMAVLYSYFGDVAAIGRVLTGISAAAAGVLIATVIKMATADLRGESCIGRPCWRLVAFVAVGPLHWPLQWMFLVLAPVGIALAWRELRARQ